MRRLFPSLLGLAALLTGCHGASGNGEVETSIIGSDLNAPLPAAIIANATDPGLVRLDREGQIIPGAAARWAILDDGIDYIFRIDDQAGVSAATIARRLRANIRRERRNPDFAALAPVESVASVTGTVIEMRLSVPQPDLLPLLARGEYAVGGPTLWRVTKNPTGDLLLKAAVTEDAPPPVHVRAERVGRAIARFQAGRSALLLGGSFTDLPVARVAQVPRDALRFDPASGLFGLAIRNAQLAPATRNALSLAIDRERIVARLGAPEQTKATTIAGSTIEAPLDQRRAAARALVGEDEPTIRVAMPSGPGARLLFAMLAQDWRSVGIRAEAVAPGDKADLMLVDRVAPAGTLATLACALSAGCDPRDRLALINPPYIPITTPVRWSLVAASLDLFTENALAVHPLNQLRRSR